MKRPTSKSAAAVATAAGAFSAGAQNAPQSKRVEDLIAGIKSTNEAVSSAACDNAPEYGPTVIRPLAFEMGGKDLEVSRRARRALYRIVRHAGRPGAEAEAAVIEFRLIGALSSPGLASVRRDVLWMLSEIATARAVQPIAVLLADKQLREDARCVLTRLPCVEAVTALRSALSTAEEEFKCALADSLRARGETVDGYSSRKMVPTAQTTVKAAQAK